MLSTANVALIRFPLPMPRPGPIDDGPVDPTDDPQRWRRAAIDAFDRGDIRQALHHWRRVQSLTPGVKDALFQIACCHALLDEPGQAYLAYQSVASDARAERGLRRRAADLARLVDPIDPIGR